VSFLIYGPGLYILTAQIWHLTQRWLLVAWLIEQSLKERFEAHLAKSVVGEIECKS
jgi:hypothetical protein